MADPRGVVWNTRLRWSRSQTDAAPHLNIYLSLSVSLSLYLSVSLHPVYMLPKSLRLFCNSPPPRCSETLCAFVNLAGKIARGVLLQWDTVCLFICALHIELFSHSEILKGTVHPKLKLCLHLHVTQNYVMMLVRWVIL